MTAREFYDLLFYMGLLAACVFAMVAVFLTAQYHGDAARGKLFEEVIIVNKDTAKEVKADKPVDVPGVSVTTPWSTVVVPAKDATPAPTRNPASKEFSDLVNKANTLSQCSNVTVGCISALQQQARDRATRQSVRGSK